MLDFGVFSAVESELYAYTENCFKLESLEDQKEMVPILRSTSEFSERVDTGGAHSDPVSRWVESQDTIERKIAILRMRVGPISKLLAYLESYEQEMFRLFRLKYVEQKTWALVDMELGLSERSRQRLRRKLVIKGARFLGLLEEKGSENGVFLAEKRSKCVVE